MTDSGCGLSAYLRENRALINGYLAKILDHLPRNTELVQAMSHSLMAGGKRLRPILALAAARACGGNPLLTLPAGCALEMIHTYSLIHDDLPAMDNDDLRRGIPTCHKKFSEATAILAGDGLLTHAFLILSRSAGIFDPVPDPATRLELTALIAESAGVTGMVAGQMLDMHPFEGSPDARLDHLKTLHGLKTGCMIRASVLAGALSIGASRDHQDALAVYATHIGLAFQVMDDILNVEGDPAIMGKAAGSDAREDKMTFPALIGLSRSREYAAARVDQAVDALREFDSMADPLRAIAGYIIRRDR